jgi:hypothetical protein
MGGEGFIVAWGKSTKKPFNSYDFRRGNISGKFFAAVNELIRHVADRAASQTRKVRVVDQ